MRGSPNTGNIHQHKIDCGVVLIARAEILKGKLGEAEYTHTHRIYQVMPCPTHHLQRAQVVF